MIEIGIDHLGPPAERLAVLDLLVSPMTCHLLEPQIIVEHVAEIMRVIAAVLLDQARRLVALCRAHRVPLVVNDSVELFVFEPAEAVFQEHAWRA